MKKKKWIALLLAGASAAMSLGNFSVFADEITAELPKATDISKEVNSAEEAITVLGLQESTEATVDTSEFEMPEEEDEQKAITTTTLAVDIVVQENSLTTTLATDIVSEEITTTTTTVAETSVTTEPIITTEYTDTNVKGTVPINYYNEIVLMLDISGSMQGDPVDAMKDAANMICEEFLKNDPTTSISIVAFDSSVSTLTKCNDLSKLKSYINSLDATNKEDGTKETNLYDGMEKVKLILETSTGQKKSVIIMLDGMPNKGCENYTIDYGYNSHQNASLQYDNENLKTNATVYSIGFFHKGSTAKKEQYVRDLASDPSKGYTANDKNGLKFIIDNIIHIIPKPTPHLPGKTEDTIMDETPVGTASTPKTGDKGIGIIIGIMTLAGLGIAIGKVKK